MERLFVKDFRMTFVLNRLFVTKFPFGNGSLQMEFVMEGLFVKDFSFGCKAVSLWKRIFVKGFPCGEGQEDLLMEGVLCLFVNGFAYGTGISQRDLLHKKAQREGICLLNGGRGIS